MENRVNNIFELVKKYVCEAGKNYTVCMEKMYKNNMMVHGVIIGKGSTCPVVYIESYNSELTDEQIAKSLIRDAEEYMDTASRYDKEIITEMMKNPKNIRGMLINTEMNKERLKTMPHKKVLDLSIIFKINIGKTGNVEESIPITYDNMSIIGMNEDEIYEHAIKNMDKPMIGNIIEILGGGLVSIDDFFCDETSIPMYVVTNKKKINGAIEIFYPNVLKKLSEKMDDDLIILPSSIHEFIVVPAKIGDAKALKQIVMDVNEIEVEPYEVLSQTPYYYERTTEQLKIAE